MIKKNTSKSIRGSAASRINFSGWRPLLVACCLCVLAAMLALPSLLPNARASARPRQEEKDKDKKQNKGKAGGNPSAQGAAKTAAPDEDEGDDPDVPNFAKGVIDKETFHARRSDQTNLLRGFEPGKPFDPSLRAQ